MHYENVDIRREKELVFLAQEDPASFGPLFDEYYPRILKYVLRRTGNPHTTQDIVSEVFYKALQNLQRFEWRNVPFSAWLYRIATNDTMVTLAITSDTYLPFMIMRHNPNTPQNDTATLRSSIAR